VTSPRDAEHSHAPTGYSGLRPLPPAGDAGRQSAALHVDGLPLCIYTAPMHFSWDEKKRESNPKDHGFDFVDAEKVL
jgi:hypothetical protein